MAIHELAAALPSAAELADLRESDIPADADAWISALRLRLGDDPRGALARMPIREVRAIARDVVGICRRVFASRRADDD